LGGSHSSTATAEMNMLIRDIGLIQNQLIKGKEALINLEVNRELQTRAAQSPSVMNAAISAELDKDPTLQGYEAQLYAIEQQIMQLSQCTERPTAQVARLQASAQQINQRSKEYRAQMERAMQDQFKAA